MIFDFRIWIFDLWPQPRRSGFARSHCNRRKLVAFLKKWINSRQFQEFGGDYQFEPETGFIRFFLNNTGFVDEVSSRFRPAKSAVVGRDRTSASDDLIRNHISAPSSGQCVSQFEDSQGEGFGSFFHFGFIHARF